MRAHAVLMQFREECRNFEAVAGHVALHVGGDGVRSESMGRCRLALTGMGGCPDGCPRFES